MKLRWGLIAAGILAGTMLFAQEPKVGHPRGTIMAVGGSVVPEILEKFMELAGGPDALILVVPTAGLDSQSTLNNGMTVGNQPNIVTDRSAEIIRRWNAAGAKNVQVLHTRDRKVADTEAFVEPIKRAGGVWFDGGLPEQIIDAYAGTRADVEFRGVLDRGGIIGGTSAGAVALGNIFTSGFQSDLNNLTTTEGFGILRGVAIQPHARVPNASFMSNHPELIRLAVPEPTAWIIRGDIAEVFGSSQAFVYRGNTSISLSPGDRYNLSSHEIQRYASASSLKETFVDSLFNDFSRPRSSMATVLVAQNGNVLVNKSYNVPANPQNIPTTTAPTFPLGGLADAFNAIGVQVLAAEGKLSMDVLQRNRAEIARAINETANMTAVSAKSAHEAFFRQKILGGVGSLIDPNRVGGDITTGEFVGSVSPLYTWERRLDYPSVFESPKPIDTTLGWQKDTFRGVTRLSLFGNPGGKRNAFIRIPEKKISVIILTNKDDADAKGIAQRITEQLLEPSSR